jgi:hypothetical protein
VPKHGIDVIKLSLPNMMQTILFLYGLSLLSGEAVENPGADQTYTPADTMDV